MKQINRNTKSKYVIVINLFLIFTLMTVSVYSWFASQVDNRVDAYDITVESANPLELSFDQVTWGGTLNLADLKTDDGNSYVMQAMKFVEVTGDGTNFRIPQLTQKKNYAEVNTGATWTTAKANKDFLQFTVYMRSKDKLDVFLSSDSAAAPLANVLTGADAVNPSVFATGDNTFSKDCVVGALRVAFQNSAGTKYIWITNPEYHLNNVIGDDVYTMTTNASSSIFSDGGYDPGDEFYWNNPEVHYYYSGNSCVKHPTANTLTALPDSISSKPGSTSLLASLSGTQNSDGYYTGSATFTVWLEGCDTEARQALVGGKFSLSLVFDTFNSQ